MIRWARRWDACSDVFVDFCREHALLDRNENLNRYWEYPWARERGRLRPGMRVLDAGAGYSAFLLHLAESVPDAEYHAADPAYELQAPPQLPHVRTSTCALEELDYPDDHFDLIFCLSVLEHLDDSARRAASRSLGRCLRPGGRLVLTVDYFLNWSEWQTALDRKPRMAAWLPAGNPDVARLVAESGLEPLDRHRIDPHPGQAGFDERAIDDDQLWWSEHIGPGLRVTSVGVVLHKPHSLYDGTARWRISPEALHLDDGGVPSLALHSGGALQLPAQRMRLPRRALDRSGFTAAELVGWLGGGPEAEEIVGSALRWGNLRSIDHREDNDAHHPESFREVYRNPEGRGAAG